MKLEMNVVRFNNEDVIATSACTKTHTAIDFTLVRDMLRVDTESVTASSKIVIGNEEYVVHTANQGGVAYNWLSVDGTSRAHSFSTDEGYDSVYYLYDANNNTYTLCDGEH